MKDLDSELLLPVLKQKTRG